MLETKWIDTKKDYKSNTGSNYASQNYHNEFAKAYGYECALQMQLRAEMRLIDNEQKICKKCR